MYLSILRFQQPVTRRLTALFIQTELCNNTLKQWLEDTTDNRKRKMVVDFFEQVHIAMLAWEVNIVIVVVFRCWMRSHIFMRRGLYTET